jgi:hypothetical protein
VNLVADRTRRDPGPGNHSFAPRVSKCVTVAFCRKYDTKAGAAGTAMVLIPDRKSGPISHTVEQELPQLVGEKMKTIRDIEDFRALDPFFGIIEQGLEGLVDGDHFFDLLAEDVVFEFIITVPDYPRQVVGRDNLIELYRGYGSTFFLDRCHTQSNSVALGSSPRAQLRVGGLRALGRDRMQGQVRTSYAVWGARTVKSSSPSRTTCGSFP